MRIRLAERCGFCFGVKRAIEMAESILKKSGPIYSLGSIIHNRDVVGRLSAKGLKVVKGIGGIRHGIIVISSHGLSPRTAAGIRKKKIRIVDTTCPFVLNAQRIAQNLSGKGYRIIIVGDARHPEVRALIDFASGRASVIKDARAAERLGPVEGSRISVISQTTQSMDNFIGVVNMILAKRPKEVRIFNTICRDAECRQDAARRLARSVDVMLVVGGAHSANTRRLYEVCRSILPRTHLIENERGIYPEWFRKAREAGITSGASTPDWIIEKVVESLHRKSAKLDCYATSQKRKRDYE